MSKKLLSVLLALVMVLGLVPVTALAAETDQFTDLDPEGWYYDDVKFAVENGYMNGVGDGKFDPTGTLTRAMFVTVLGRYGKAETDATRTSFTDVPIGEWYTGYVTWASDNRIVEGDGTGRFNPEGNITNQEMATIIDRFVTWYGNAFNKEHVIKGEAKTFIDQASIPSWAIDHVTQAQIYGLMHGDQNGAFNPLATSQRAQAAALLHRLEWKDKTTVQPDKPDKPDKPDNPTPPAPGGGGIGGGGSKSYTVTFDLNYEGATGTPDSQTVKKNTAVKFPADPTREGHTFKGWTTTKEDKEPYYNSESTDYKVKSDVTFYAQWEVNSYTVTFNANGGAPAPQSQTVKFGGKVTEPGEMTKADHIFDGWYTDSELTEKVDFDTFTMPAKDITLYAKWNIEQVTVTVYLNKDDPAETPVTTTLDKGGKFTVPEAPTWDKHRFLGWSDTKEGPADPAKYPAGQEITVNADLTLYAQWIEQVTVTVHYNSTQTDPAPTVLDKGGEFTIPTPDAYDGHEFAGWATTQGGEPDDTYKPGETVTVNADLDLYAVWKNVYTIKFFSDDTQVGAFTVTEGGTYTVPKNPTKAGYRFMGWAAVKGGTDPVAEIVEDAVITPTASAEYYAIWAEEFTVSFNYNYTGSPDEPYKTFTNKISGEKIQVPEAPARDGYRFMGWAESAAGSVTIQPDAAGTDIEVTGNKTYYAIWAEEFTVTFFYNYKDEGEDIQQTYANKIAGEKITVPDAPVRDGYRFMGWATEKTGSVSLEKDKAGTEIEVTGNTSYYAIWEQEFTVTFHNNYTGAPSDVYQSYPGKIKGETVTIPADPTRDGYKFLGWAETADGEVVDTYKAGGTITVDNKDISLYAKWGVEYTVTLKNGEDTVDTTVVVVPEGKTATYTFEEKNEPKEPTDGKTGSVFLGWSTKSGANEAEKRTNDTLTLPDDIKDPSKTATYYAVWAFDYLKEAVEGSVKTFNEKLGANINSAVKTLVEELNKWIKEDTTNGGDLIETEVEDTLEITVEDLEGQTINVTVKAATNSPSMLALGEFAIRYGYTIATNGSGLDDDLSTLKAKVREIVIAALENLGIEDPVSLRDIDGLVDKLIGNYKQDYVDAFLNLNGKTSVEKVNASFGSHSLEAVAGQVTKDTAKEAVKAMALAIRDAAHGNTEFDKKIDGTVTIKADFTTAELIKPWYSSDTRNLPDGMPFKNEYTVNLKFELGSDYLDYKFAGGEDYVKITLPEKVETAWEAKFPTLIDKVIGSAAVQAQLQEISDKIKNEVKSSQSYQNVIKELEKLVESVSSNALYKSMITSSFSSAIDTWMQDNHLAPKDGTMNVMESFLVTGEESDNAALYNFVTTWSGTIGMVVKAKIDLSAIPDQNGISSSTYNLSAPSSDSVPISVTIPFDQGHNPKQLILDAIKNAKENPSELASKITEALNTCEKDIQTLKTTYLTKDASKSSIYEQYSALNALIEKSIGSFNTTNIWRPYGFTTLKQIVDEATTAVDNATQSIAKIRQQLQKLNVTASPENKDLFDPILDHFFAGIIVAFVDGEEISETVVSNMKTALDTFISTAIDSKKTQLTDYTALISAVRKLEKFDEVWKTKLGSFEKICDNQQVKTIINKMLADESTCSKIKAAVDKIKPYLEKLPDGASVKIKDKTFDKTELNKLLTAVETCTTEKSCESLLTALKGILCSDDLKDLSLSSFTEEGKILVTVTYNGHSANFYLVLEHDCPNA